MNRTKIKICGITNLKDALFSAEKGVDFLGFIFYKKSPRYIEPDLAKEIIEKIPSHIKAVGVFVNETVEEIKRIKDFTGINFIQLHGDEDIEFCYNFDLEKLIKVVRISPKGLKSRESKESNEVFKSELKYVLFDTYSDKEYGGTGEVFDWDMILDFKKKFKGNIFLSGGINADNVVEAVNKVQPYAVDICSGVEKEPGIKDLEKVEKIFNIVVRHNQNNI